jgi:hypothetical protein
MGRRLGRDEASFYIEWEGNYRVSFPFEYCNYTIGEPNEEGFSKVKYYTDIKLKDKYEGNGLYYVYVLSNPSYPDELKIGYTKKHPQTRCKEISRGTGVMHPFKVEWAFKCHNGEFLEREVHNRLAHKRVNPQREFFQVSLEEVKEVITLLGKKYI